MRYFLLFSPVFWFIFLISDDAQAFSFSDLFQKSVNISQYKNQHISIQKSILAKTNNLNPTVLGLALNAYDKLYKKGFDRQKMLTIIDYSKPSTERRLWVIDLNRPKVIFHTLVAHGKNSGNNVSARFSDNPNSLKSSIGVYLTGDTYIGKHGYSLRLNGLEPGFNAKARVRDVVIHAASYVSDSFAKIHGRLGRSWGCPAVSPEVAPQMIGHIKNGTVLFAYYPDPQWLDRSAYLRV